MGVLSDPYYLPPMTASPPTNAGVRVPPPLLYAAAFIIGLLLQRWHPLTITSADETPRLIGAALFGGLFLGFFVSAFTEFRKARTTLIPNHPASALVTTGVYRLTRNPMYVSLVTLYICAALILNAWWPCIVLPLLIVVIDRAVIGREERYLAAAFPDAYPAYVSRVRRWI